MFKFWQLLKLYLVLGADGDVEEPAEEVETPVEEASAEEVETGDLDSLIENSDVEPVEGEEIKPKPRENAAIRDARLRAQTAEEARIRAEATLDAERRMRSAPPNEDQKLFEDEERKLKDPNVTEQDRYWINANRTLRANTSAANNALTTAADVQDRTAFDRLAISNPKVYKAYEDKVEKALVEMRSKGQNAPRLALLRFMIGNDILEGKLKSTPKKKAEASSSGTGAVPRGQSPGARSDVTRGGRQTEHEKRAKRLENVQL